MIPARTIAAVTAYTASITAANWLTAHYDLITIVPGVTATAGTLAAGAALLARDLVQDTAGRTWVLVGIAAGAALTWATSPVLAFASVGAFVIAEAADMAVYTPLRDRGWARAVLASNIVGGILDTLIFLWLAGFPIVAATVTGQLVGKVLWATLLPVAVVTAVRRWRRAVPRHALGA